MGSKKNNLKKLAVKEREIPTDETDANRYKYKANHPLS